MRAVKRFLSRAAAITCLAALLSQSEMSFAFDLPLHGFAQGNYSAGTKESNPDGKNFKWAEERVQLKLDLSPENYELFIKQDFSRDGVDTTFRGETREAFAGYSGTGFDLRAGRQIFTWGTGDLVFINDVFPKDYEAFFSGRPLEYMKKGVDSLKAGLYAEKISLEAIAIPFFEPNTYPSEKRFHVFDPMSSVTNRHTSEPSSTFENTEIALRVYGNLFDYDSSLYFYKGFYRTPSFLPDSMPAPTELEIFYPRMNSYGASVQGRALDGVLSVEAGYYDSRDDKNGSNSIIPNSEARFLLGYQRQMWEDFTASFQYYAEYMSDYSEYKNALPTGFPKRDRVHTLVTMRLTQFLKYQTVRLSLFSFYSPSDEDYFVTPEIKYNLSDTVWLAAGYNIFGGKKETTQFGQFDRDDNLYSQMRYEF